MFSGGLDSLILKELLEFSNDECLFINIGTDENKQEELFLDTYFPGVLKDVLDLKRFELINKIIPFRNCFLSLIAAQYSSNIYFGFTAGDTTKDKDYIFKSQMEGLLSYFIAPEKTPFPVTHYTIQIPYKEMTKTELIGLYIKKGKDVNLLKQSNSCYYHNCGQCRSCLRRYIAFYLNDIQDFHTPSIKQLQEHLEESIKKNRNQEVKEILLCIKKRQR